MRWSLTTKSSATVRNRPHCLLGLYSPLPDFVTLVTSVSDSVQGKGFVDIHMGGGDPGRAGTYLPLCPLGLDQCPGTHLCPLWWPGTQNHPGCGGGPGGWCSPGGWGGNGTASPTPVKKRKKAPIDNNNAMPLNFPAQWLFLMFSKNVCICLLMD